MHAHTDDPKLDRMMLLMKHRESLSESRANIFQSGVLIGGRPGFKLPEAKSDREWDWVVSYTCQVVLKDNLPHDLQSFNLWHRVSLSSPSNHGPANFTKSGEQCPGPAVLRPEEGDDFLAGPSTGWPAPALWFSGYALTDSVVIR